MSVEEDDMMDDDELLDDSDDSDSDDIDELEITHTKNSKHNSDARRRLEALLEEKRLARELADDDDLDYDAEDDSLDDNDK